METLEKKETFKERLQRYVNNRCSIKPRRNRSYVTKYNNEGTLVNQNHIMGFGKNYAVVFLPKRKKLKGWQKHD